MRDDFDLKIKETLAKRVGYRCSNPGCREQEVAGRKASARRREKGQEKDSDADLLQPRLF